MCCFDGGKSSGSPVPRGCQRASGKLPEERQDTEDDGAGRRGMEPLGDLHWVKLHCNSMYASLGCFLMLLERWGPWGQSAVSNTSGG